MKKRNFNFQKSFACVIAIVFGALIVSCGSQDGKVFKALQEATAQINRGCPMVVDEITTLTSTEAIQPKTLQYNMVVNMEGVESESDLALIKAEIDSTVVSDIKKAQGLKTFFDMDVTIVYSYKTTDGKPFTEVKITPDQYK